MEWHLVILGALVLVAGVACYGVVLSHRALLRDMGAWHD